MSHGAFGFEAGGQHNECTDTPTRRVFGCRAGGRWHLGRVRWRRVGGHWAAASLRLLPRREGSGTRPLWPGRTVRITEPAYRPDDPAAEAAPITRRARFPRSFPAAIR